MILLSGGNVSAARIVSALGYTPAANGTSPSYYDFLLGTTTASLPGGMSFTRASSATRRNSSGYIETISTDVPAWQYAVGGTARGLRVFGSVTNQIKQATTITGTSATASPTRGTTTANATTSPDGTSNAVKFVEDTTATNTHYYYCANLSGTAGTVYCWSAYAKAAERTWVTLQTYTGIVSPGGTSYFNIGGGVVGTKSARHLTSGIEDAGNGWYRIWITFTADLTNSSGVCGVGMASGDLGDIYTGDGTSGEYFWGFQFEAGAGPTSFIPTTTATVTRAADTGLVSNANALADQAWVIKARTPMYTAASGTTQVLFQVDDGTDSNRRVIYRNTSNKIIVQADVAGVSQCALDLGTVANDTDFIVSARFADNLFAASLNGGAIVTDVSGTNPLGLSTARIGKDSSGNYWSSTIRTLETRRIASDTDLPLLSA